jgi:all-trans-retinol 13,14-reductase
MQGASYPIGGSSQIALTIIPVIERAGGKVLVRAPVTSILTDENGNVNGVQVGRSSGPVDIRAPLVISDAGIVNTFTRLLPTEIAQKSSIHQLLTSGKVESGVSCMSVFVGLRGTTQELGIKSQNIWSYVSNDLDGLMNDLMSKESSELSHFDIPLLFLSFPSTKDPTYQERYPGKTMCTLVTMAKWEWFERWKNDRVMKRGEDYESLKKTVADKMWKSALEFYPQLADKVEYFEVGTPVTNNYYLNTPRGEIYGLEHNTTRFGNPEIAMNLRANTGIPGLMLTGQDIVSCGFTGALLGGLMCASSVLKRNLYGDLAALRKQLRKAK